MKLSNKILIGLLTVVILFQFIMMIKVKSFIKDAMYYQNDINQTILNKLLDSKIIEKNYEFDDFSELNLQFKGNVIIQKSENYKITVEAPLEFQESEYFKVDTYGNSLHIESPSFKNHHRKINIIIEMPELKKIKGREQIDIIFNGFDEKNMKVLLTGDCSLQGNNNTINNFELDAFGDIDIDLKDTKIKDTKIKAIGDCDFNMNVKNIKIEAFGHNNFDLVMNGGKLKGSIIGDGHVNYEGRISKNSLKLLGPGKVRKR